jgi:hypothetical protein
LSLQLAELGFTSWRAIAKSTPGLFESRCRPYGWAWRPSDTLYIDDSSHTLTVFIWEMGENPVAQPYMLNLPLGHLYTSRPRLEMMGEWVYLQ